VVWCSSIAARERVVGLGHDERRARHALDAPGDHDARVPVASARAPCTIASPPDAHSRFTVVPGR
jgi:hypothetical protein